jgi:DNA-binding NtrC family response regulator
VKKILVAEDEPTLREGIATAFRDRGWQVEEAVDGSAAIARLEQEVYDVLVTDYKMPGSSGLEVVKRCKMLNESTVALVMTAFGTVESAVEAMKAGTFDYVLKPFDLEELEMKVERALEHRRLLSRLQAYDREVLFPKFENIVGESPQMKEIFRTIEKVARSNATVLILGEIVKMNCAALHENLLESELFGHERGSFTGADRQRIGRFELANEGTLFLDEIGSMTLSTQTKVLRILQEREFERLGGNRTVKVDVRMVAATNANLEETIARGEFREDLFYRINVVNITVPPLRERKQDIVPLAHYFVDRFSGELKKEVKALTPSGVRALQRHTWPGNIRELENTIERAVLMCDADVISSEDLNLDLQLTSNVSSLNLRLPPTGIDLEDLEKQAILEALRINNWVQKEAAKFLGISSRVMNYKVAKYEIKNPRWSKNKLVS